ESIAPPQGQLYRDRFGVKGGAAGWRDDGCVARLNGDDGGRLGRRGRKGGGAVLFKP
ncbi:hypothetical protein A2U01_0071065, partial [Trifolium medium]|nr:hypothetical protein [Trifolium medium]